MNKKLHITRTIEAISPKYVTRFSCIGPECEDNCCSGWKVSIDRKTFNFYKRAGNDTLSERFTNSLKRTRSESSDLTYGRIQLVESTGSCPFFEEKLCSIQSELGEDKLSNTCHTYPRSITKHRTHFEQILTLSCPEAARLALLASDAFEYIESNFAVREEIIQKKTIPSGWDADVVSSVRIFCLQLMNTEGLSTWKKLALLGIFCERLTEIQAPQRATKVAEIIASATGLVEHGGLEATLEQTEAHTDVQALTFVELWRARAGVRRSPHQEAVRRSILKGLGVDDSTGLTTTGIAAKRYAEGLTILKDALESAPKLFDHFLLNDMIRESFPFAEKDPFEHYVRLVTRFGMVRMMLASVCRARETVPPPEQLASTVQVFCRIYQHDEAFAKQINNALRTVGWNRLDKIFRFLKD